jgi:fatty-acyl-CoA synthase
MGNQPEWITVALGMIEAERCTVFYGTPNMVHALIMHPSRATRDLSSLRTGSTAGTPAMMARAMELGVPDAERVEVVAAVVVLQAGASTSDAALLDHCRASLAAYKVPRRLAQVRETDLPLTTTGKIQRSRVASQFFGAAA